MTSTRRWTSGAVLLAMLASSCMDVTRGVRGVALLTSPPCASSDVPPGTAAQSAEVSIACPGDAEPRYVARTDIGGRFFVDLQDDDLEQGCEVHVRKTGYGERHFGIAEVCVHGIDDGQACEAASVVVELVPAATMAVSPSTEKRGAR